MISLASRGYSDVFSAVQSFSLRLYKYLISLAHSQLEAKKMTVKTRLLTYKELRAEKIKMARSTLWTLEKEGKFPLRRIHGGRVYWVESEIDSWIMGLDTLEPKA